MKEAILESSKNHMLFIVSSGGTKNITDYLRNNNVADSFKEIIGMDTYRSKVDKFKFIFSKYQVTAQDCVFITDTLGDILEANTLHIKTIAVDFGYHTKETLSKGDPLKIVSTVSELFQTLREY